MTFKILMTFCLMAAVLCGCATGDHENRETVAEGSAYQAQYRIDDAKRIDATRTASAALNARRCTQEAHTHAGARHFDEQELLSRGDLVSVEVEGDETFSGQFEVGRDGLLKLPYLDGVMAHAQSVAALETAIADRLVAARYHDVAPRLSVRVSDFAPARVYVSGAVFTPGAVDIGGTAGADIDAARQSAIGASTEARSLAQALQFAGGVRPDADIARVSVFRGGLEIPLDLRAAIAGGKFADIMLLADDEVVVPSRNCFQEAIVRPSPITPPGVKVFMSNLTKPADANALSAVGKDARELRYGTRFIQAVVGMNCVGGARATNANRSAVLFSRNPITGESIVIERRIEDMLSRADRDELDPFILPGDAIACYDSAVTNVAELAKAFSVVIAAPLAGLAIF